MKVNISKKKAVFGMVTVASYISVMNIKDLWSGIISMLCTVAMFILISDIVGDFEDE